VAGGYLLVLELIVGLQFELTVRRLSEQKEFNGLPRPPAMQR
jgi:hypothetical protein